MAVQSIAFDPPAIVPSPKGVQSRPIDLIHLATQTMGDKALEIDVLQIFAKQARNSLKALMDGEGDAAAVAHRLKGAASAVGAFAVADAASVVEAKGADPAAIAAVATAVIAAEHFILKLCRS